MGVITGLMGSGKTTLLYHLFGEPPPDLYTSTGVAEQSFRGLLHHTLHLSANTWQRLSHKDIRELLAPLIRAGMREAAVDYLASRLMYDLNPTASTGVPTNPLDPAPSSTSATASVPSKTEASLSLIKSPPLPWTKSPSCQEMVPLVQSTASAGLIVPDHLKLEMAHMIDTGGQPELMEVMPCLIHNADLAIALLNLEYGLSELQQVDYHEKGEGYKRKTPSRLSSRDIILKLASTLHGKKSLHEPFRLFIVATHRDCVEGDLEVRVETLNRELCSLLLPAFENELLLFEKPNKIAFVLDLKNPDDSDKRALELIRREVGKPCLGKTFEIPISFFVFEQDLLQFAESEAKRDILSLDECKTVGARLKMSQEMVVAALVLFHSQNTFLYFHNVLPNHVFIKPQVPLDIVNSIVAFSYKKLQGVPSKLVSQLENGIITEELLGYDQISPHFQTGVYEVQDAIRLFCHTLTLAPLHHEEDPAHPVPNSEREYLMMCLKPSIPDQELHRHIPTSSDTVPLVVRFSSGCVPLGCFGSTISCLLSKYRWEVVRGEDGTPNCLAHNIASLHDPQLLVNVLLVDFTQYLELHVSCDLGIHQLPPNTCSLVLTTVLGAIEKVFEIMRLDGDKMGISPAVLCPCTKVKEKHFARFTRRGSEYLLRCLQSIFEPDEKHMWWMGNEMANTKPTLPQLIRLKIPEKVGGHYRKFGTLLLNDDTGCLVDIAEESCHYQPDDIVTNILRKWLQEGPTPVTWDNLIQVLRDCCLQGLAQYVEHNHREVIHLLAPALAEYVEHTHREVILTAREAELRVREGELRVREAELRVREMEGERERELEGERERDMERDRPCEEKRELEGKRERERVELQEVQARAKELQRRPEEVERREHEKSVVQEQAIVAEQRGPSWEVMEEELEETKTDVIAEKTMQVTNEEQHIDWEGYGLRLHIHQNSLPENCTQFQLKIAVTRAKVCKLPTDNGILVSGVYSFTHNLGNRKLRRPATLELQHCVVSGSHSPLSIVQSEEVSPPFLFDIHPGGKLDSSDRYASLELDHFCSFGVYLKWYFSSVIRTIATCAVLYYTNIMAKSFQFRLFITPQLDAILKVSSIIYFP